MKKSQIVKTAQMVFGGDEAEDMQNDNFENTANRRPVWTPTIGTLEHAIMVDQRLTAFERRYALQKLQMETRFAPPSTPLNSSILSSLGSGVLGAIVARMLGLGGLGVGIAAVGGYGLGKAIADFYLNQAPERNRAQML